MSGTIDSEGEAATRHFPAGDSELSELLRRHDWSNSAIGRPDNWPPSVRASVQLMLASRFPMFVAWGPELTFLYNDSYAQLLGSRHPSGLGQPFAEVWPEIWSDIEPLVRTALAGKSTFVENLHLVLKRNGYPESAWYSFSYAPILDDDGTAQGMFCTCTETTIQVLAERRQTLRLSLEEQLTERSDPVVIVAEATTLLGKYFDTAQVGFVEVDDSSNHVAVTRDWTNGRAPIITEKWFMENAELRFIEQMKAGIAVTIPDVRLDDRTSEQSILAAFNEIRAAAILNVPLIRDGRLRAVMFIHSAAPRIWTVEDIAFVTEASSRLWSAVSRAKAELELRISEELNRRMLASSADCIKVLDNDARLEFMSEGGLCIMEVEDFGAVKGTSWLEFWKGEGHAKALAAVEEAKMGGTGRFQGFAKTMKGSPRWWDVIVTPINDEDGNAEKLLLISRDITSTKEAEAALRESEEQLRLATEAAEVGLWDWNLTTNDMFWPPRVKEMFGISPEASVVMEDFYTGVHPDDAEYTMSTFAAAMDPEQRAIYDVEYRTIGKEDGLIRWIAAKGKGQFDDKGTCIRILGTAIDITERKLIEAKLHDLNASLEARVAERTEERDRTWNNARDLLLVIDTAGIFRAANPAWTTILGWMPDEVIGRSYLEFIHPDDHPSSEDALETASQEALPSYANRYRHKDGSYRWISWVAAPEADMIYASGRDISHERDREEELVTAREALRQSQKMDAMGQLTGGVAHDFNNLLTPIVGTLDMLRRRNVGTEREQMLIDGAMQSAERAKLLIQRLLSFARRQPLQATAVDVGMLVAGMADLISSTTGPQVRVIVEIADELPAALADANQLEMALLNLGVNARDAMPDGGTLRITATAETIGGLHGAGIVAGDYVRLSVADTGTGMDSETAKRAVEPFFSTKGIGQGTGLGLSMVHGLAQQLGGGMVIESTRGVGTKIDLWLPVTDAPTEKPAVAPHTAIASDNVGTVLLVDDEQLVRVSTADMLNDLGYQVVEAPSAEHALSLLQQGLRPDVVVTDHLMPGMNGTELARYVQNEYPAAKILIISGYADAQGIASDLPRLTKPFRNDELAAALAVSARASSVVVTTNHEIVRSAQSKS